MIATVATVSISPASAAKQITPGLWHIRITSQLISKSIRDENKISASALYNKTISSNAIGNSVTYCIPIGHKRTLPKGTQFCRTVFRMPLGQIVTAGIVTSDLYYKLAILGGTGVYSNIGGEVLIQATKLVPRKEKLVFTITAF